MLVPTNKPKAIISDVDSTLTERTTWYYLTEQLGASSFEHANIFTNYLKGKISWAEAKKQLFKMWNANGRIHRDKLVEIFENVPVRGEAISLINTLQEKGYEICLISGSITMFVEIMANKFGIKHHYANSVLEFDDEGYWVDISYSKDEDLLKSEQLHDFLEKTGLKADECLAIADGDNDVEIFREVPGIAINPKNEHLEEMAWHSVKYLPRILQLLESIEEK